MSEESRRGTRKRPEIKLRWKVRIKNLLTDQEIHIFVDAAGPESARMAALRVVFVHLDWRKALAYPTADVTFAGLPVRT